MSPEWYSKTSESSKTKFLSVSRKRPWSMSIAIHRQSVGFKLVWMTGKTKVQTRINACLLSYPPTIHHFGQPDSYLLDDIPTDSKASARCPLICLTPHWSKHTALASSLGQLLQPWTCFNLSMSFLYWRGGNTGHSTYMWSSEHWEEDNHCPWCPGCAPVDAPLDVVGHFCSRGMLVFCAHVMVWNRKHSTETSFQLFFF